MAVNKSFGACKIFIAKSFKQDRKVFFIDVKVPTPYMFSVNEGTITLIGPLIPRTFSTEFLSYLPAEALSGALKYSESLFPLTSLKREKS